MALSSSCLQILPAICYVGQLEFAPVGIDGVFQLGGLALVAEAARLLTD